MDLRFLSLSLLTVLLWGIWGFFGKLAVAHGMPPLGVFIVEILISLAVVGAVIIFAEERRNSLGPWNIYGVISGLGLSTGLLVYYLLLQKGQASIVIPLTASYPLIATILSVAFLHERLRPVQWIGIFLTIAGLIMLLSYVPHRSR